LPAECSERYRLEATDLGLEGQRQKTYGATITFAEVAETQHAFSANLPSLPTCLLYQHVFSTNMSSLPLAPGFGTYCLHEQEDFNSQFLIHYQVSSALNLPPSAQHFAFASSYLVLLCDSVGRTILNRNIPITSIFYYQDQCGLWCTVDGPASYY
jgi:hypothetical protein